MPPQTVPEHTGPEETGPEETESGETESEETAQPLTAPVTPAAPTVRILPAQSREDTDAGWGDYRDPDDDDRLLRDRPPHWGNG